MKKIITLFLCLCFVFPSLAVAQQRTVCFCVTLARQYSPDVPNLDAEYWYLLPRMTRSVPMIGGQILLKYETLWDVATILRFTDKGFEVSGVDFATCRETRRVIAYTDPRIYTFFDF